jgi:hypothetical protein
MPWAFLFFAESFGMSISVGMCCSAIATNVFAAWRSGGFLAQKFNRRTALEPTTKLSYEALHPPLHQTAVSGCLSFRPH